jgi:23S rRNA (cytidine1920-2'-O)/16S rRNA (cytidine1409-2'-O)-methyltransferase
VTATRQPRRRLDADLVRRGLVESRSAAAEAIASGRVLVNGSPTTSASRRVAADEALVVLGPPRPYVSRGGQKLEAALRAFAIDVRDHRALDAGASTGGFTDCLLQHGAAHVMAVDVGRGQLAWGLRTDTRVTVLEKTNLRELQPEAIGGPVRLAVADLSFISLLTVAPALGRCTVADAELVVLIKPQFEAGREAVGRGGVVRDPAAHRDVVLRVTEGLGVAGLSVIEVIASPITGADGNREFLAHIRRGVTPVAPELLAESALAAPVS